MAAAATLNGYPIPTQTNPGYPAGQPRLANGVPIPSFMPDDVVDTEFDDAPAKTFTESPPKEDFRLVGYYINNEASPIQKTNGFPSAVPNFGDLSQNRRRLSTDQSPQSILDRRIKRTSRSPSPLGHARAFSVGTNSAPLASAPFQANGKLTPNRPVIVNGSVNKPASTPGSSRPPPPADLLASDEASFDNPLYISQGHGYNGSWAEQPAFHPAGNAEPNSSALADRPVIVNGSSSSRSPVAPPSMTETLFQQRIGVGAALQNAPTFTPLVDEMNGLSLNGSSPPSVPYTRVITRQQQNGIAPLDLATGDFAVAQDMQHLSPVYENRTPSPAAVRRFDTPVAVQSPIAGTGKDHRLGVGRTSQKTPPMKVPPMGPPAKQDSQNRSPVLESRVNGASRENGHVRSAKSQSVESNGWQRTKARKKGVSDLKSVANGYSHGEQLPKDEVERKGG